MKITKILLGLLLMVFVLAISGCETTDPASSNKNNPKPPVNNSTQTVEMMDIRVYYPNSDATRLVAEKKKVKTTAATKYRAVVEALLEGPSDSKLTKIFPKDAKVLGVTVSGDTARVDFNRAILDNFNGGSTGEEMLVGSVVNTLTEFPEIKKVQFVVEGRRIDSIKGHMDTSKPLTRMEELLK